MRVCDVPKDIISPGGLFTSLMMSGFIRKDDLHLTVVPRNVWQHFRSEGLTDFFKIRNLNVQVYVCYGR